LKRELLFWLVAAGVMGGYIALGGWLAPQVPPEPERGFGIIKLKNTEDLQRELTRMREEQEARKDAQRRHNEFLRDWYRWGAAVAIALVLIHTWIRPPWRPPVERDSKPNGRPAKPASRALPVSRRAMFLMAATLLLVIAALVFVASLFP
jgi:hypothetical protein